MLKIVYLGNCLMSRSFFCQELVRSGACPWPRLLLRRAARCFPNDVPSRTSKARVPSFHSSGHPVTPTTRPASRHSEPRVKAALAIHNTGRAGPPSTGAARLVHFNPKRKEKNSWNHITNNSSTCSPARECSSTCSVRYWRGCKKLRPEDLGLDAQDVSDRLISLGHKRLLPKEATADLALIEGRAHALIEANTFPFLNGLGHFLPNAKLAEVTGKLHELEAEFWRAKENFVGHYASAPGARRGRMARRRRAKLVTDPDRWSPPSPRHSRCRWKSTSGSTRRLFQIAVPEQISARI